MIEYEIKVGEVFTQKKADELIEYLRLKDEKSIENYKSELGKKSWEMRKKKIIKGLN